MELITLLVDVSSDEVLRKVFQALGELTIVAAQQVGKGIHIGMVSTFFNIGLGTILLFDSSSTSGLFLKKRRKTNYLKLLITPFYSTLCLMLTFKSIFIAISTMQK